MCEKEIRIAALEAELRKARHIIDIITSIPSEQVPLKKIALKQAQEVSDSIEKLLENPPQN